MMNLFETQRRICPPAPPVLLMPIWLEAGFFFPKSGIYLGETRFDQVPQLKFLNTFARAAHHECKIDGGEGAVSVLAVSGYVYFMPAEAFLISL